MLWRDLYSLSDFNDKNLENQILKGQNVCNPPGPQEDVDFLWEAIQNGYFWQ